MTELEILQLLVTSSDSVAVAVNELIDSVGELTVAIKFVFITILIFYVRWETKGGTFKR